MPTEEERRRRVRGTRTPIQREEPASDPVRSGIGDLARGAYNTARGISNAVGSVTVGPALDLGANAIALATGNTQELARVAWPDLRRLSTKGPEMPSERSRQAWGRRYSRLEGG